MDAKTKPKVEIIHTTTKKGKQVRLKIFVILGFALLHVTIVAWQGVLELEKDFRVLWRNRTYDFCVLTYAQLVVVCYFVQHGKNVAQK